MNARRRPARNDEAPVFKYVMWFVAALFIVGIPIGILQMILPDWMPLQFLLGLGLIFGAAEFVRWRFNVDHGRGLSPGERMRLFIGSQIVLFLMLMLTVSIGIQAHNSGPFAFRKIPPAFALLVAVGGVVIYALPLWASYWLRNRAGEAEAAAVVPERAQRRAPGKVMVIGSGGREHALAWKLAQSAKVSEVIVAPGNAGTARERKCRNVAVDIRDIDALLQLARREQIAVTVVGPEGPLVAGVVDRFRTEGLRIFGPTAAAAQLEGSKAFAKDFLARHGIPTAHYAVHTELDAALAYLRDKGAPIVVKADGLAAGKGVIVAMTLDEAEAAVRDMLSGNAFGAAGARVVIEEFLDGEEASFISMVDGRTALPMATSQDHKRVGDGDTGPNTGGMGAYSPAPVVTPEVHDRVMREVVEPTVRGMAADGVPFTGFLYAGLMIDRSGAPKVIEFNVRFGDPETQPVMLRLQSDLLDLVEAALDRQLDLVDARWNPRPSLGVVMAAAQYPDTPKTGDPIAGLDTPLPMGTKVFHAGTRLDESGRVVTSGGRVLCVCALGDTVAEAQREAYAAVAEIAWDGEFHRTDIGWRAIARERG
jgi:phosphoribosylamine--glycine ligase